MEPNGKSNRLLVAKTLTDARTRKHLSVRAAAKVAGVPPATVQGWLSGRYLPTPALRPNFERLIDALGVQREVESLLEDINPATHPRGDDDAPYVGLRPFGIRDAPIYFGRDAEATRLARFIVEQATPHGIVAVLGASGSGKSSLLAAGLIGTHCRPGGLLEERRGAVSTISRLDDPPDADLLVVDQFEEALLLDAPHREVLWARLASLSAERTVILAIRSKAFAELSEAPLMAATFSHPFIIQPMSDEELRESIIRPAEQRGVTVEPALFNAILRDVTPSRHRLGFDALPLLSNALLMTWSLGQGTVMRLTEYEQSGGLASAVQALAENTFAGLPETVHEAARGLFLKLVKVSDDVEFCTRVSRTELSATEQDVARHFVDARILVGGTHEIRVGHEALIRYWPRLAKWVNDARSDLEAREQLRASSELWIANDRAPEWLLPHGRLGLYEHLLTDPHKKTLLGATEQEFLTASRDNFTSMLDVERSRTRAFRRRGIAALAFAVVSLCLAVVSTFSLLHAQNVQKEAQSRHLAMRSYGMQHKDPNLQAQIALISEATARTTESTSALLDAASMDVPLRWLGPPSATLAINLEHRRLARLSGSGQVTLWATDQLDQPGASFVTDPATTLLAGTFVPTPDALLLAMGGTNAMRTLWDVTGEPRLVADFGSRERDVAVEAVAHDPVHQRLVTVLSSGTIEVWSMADPRRPALESTLPGTSRARAAVFAPDGARLYTSVTPGSISIWDMTGSTPHPLPSIGFDHISPSVAQTIALSPDGRFLAAGLADKHVVRFDLSEPEPRELSTLTEFTSYVNQVAFTPDSSTLIVGSSDFHTRVYDWHSGVMTRDLLSNAQVTGVALIDDRPVATIVDGSLRVWPAQARLFTATSGSVYQFATDSASNLVAGTASRGDTTMLWRVAETIERLPDAHAPEGIPLSAGTALTPDATHLFSGSRHGGIVHWPVAPDGAVGSPVHTPVFAEGGIAVLNLNREGTLMVAPHYIGLETALLGVADDGRLTVLARLATPQPQYASFNASSTLLQVGVGNGDIQLWDVRTPTSPTLVSSLPFESIPTASSFHPTEDIIAVGGESGEVTTWDVSDPSSPRLLATVGEPHSAINSLVFSPDGQSLVATSGDDQIWGWDLKRAEADPRFTLTASVGRPWDARYVSGTNLLVGGGTEGVRFWETDPAHARATLCRGLGDQLTPDEWSRHLPRVTPTPLC